MLSFLLATFLTVAQAKQTKHKITKNPDKWSFNQSWTDASNKKHKVSFSLDKAPIREDLDEPFRFQRKNSAEYVAKKVKTWAKKQKGVTIKVKAKRGRVQIALKGKASKVRQAKKDVQDVQNAQDAQDVQDVQNV